MMERGWLLLQALLDCWSFILAIFISLQVVMKWKCGSSLYTNDYSFSIIVLTVKQLLPIGKGAEVRQTSGREFLFFSASFSEIPQEV
jgi:hypothetical protein